MNLSRALALAGLMLLAPVFQCSALGAEPTVWRPSSGHAQIPIWPGVAPDAPSVPRPESLTRGR